MQLQETGERLEPVEEVVIDVDDDYTGVVIEKLSARKAELKDMEARGVNQRELRIVGALESGVPVTVIVQVPRNFNWDAPGA